MSEQHISTVQSVYEAFGRGDVPAILGMLSDDVRWDQRGDSGGVPFFEPRQDDDDVVNFFVALQQSATLTRLDITNLLSGGNQVAAVIEVGLNIGGQQVDEFEVHLWTFDDDGKISAFDHILDRTATVAALSQGLRLTRSRAAR